MKVYYDKDAQLDNILSKKVAIIGFGVGERAAAELTFEVFVGMRITATGDLVAVATAEELRAMDRR